MANKLTQLEDVIDNLENQVDSIKGFKDILAKIESLNNDTVSVRGSVDDSAKLLEKITLDLESGIKKIEATNDTFNDALKTEIENFRVFYDSFDKKNREFEARVIDKLSSLESNIHSNLETSVENVRKEFQILGGTINAMGKEINQQNAQVGENISKKLSSVESCVDLGFKSLANEQARGLKLTALSITILIIASTVVNYYF